MVKLGVVLEKNRGRCTPINKRCRGYRKRDRRKNCGYESTRNSEQRTKEPKSAEAKKEASTEIKKILVGQRNSAA